MIESRGTGLTPNRMPSQWEKRPLEMSKEAPQGAAETSRPTSRSLAPIPGEVTSKLSQGDPGGFLGSVLASRPSAAVPSPDGDQQLTQTFGAVEEIQGSANISAGKGSF